MTTTSPRTVSITSIRPAYYRIQRPLIATHALAHELPGGAVGTTCGRVFGLGRTAGLAIDPEPRPVTCSVCRQAQAL